MFRVVVGLLLFLTMTGCKAQYSDFFPTHDDGRQKPSLAVLPVLDQSDSSLPWDVAEEMTLMLRQRLMRTGDVYVIPQQQVTPILAQIGKTDVFGNDLSFAKKFSSKCDFVTATELVAHRIVPYTKGKIEPLYITQGPVSHVLQMQFRIRIIDVRRDTPRVVLQELLESNHMIAVTGDHIDYKDSRWGSKHFLATPLGLAHIRLIKDVGQRLEDSTIAIR